MHEEPPDSNGPDASRPTVADGPAARPAGEPDWIDVGIGALNGVLGDYLVARNNDLATTMAVFHDNKPLTLERAPVALALPDASPKLCVLVHGLCCTEASWQFPGAPQTNYGTLLRDDLGITPVFVRYNTGLHISENGRAFARLLDRLVQSYPVEPTELTLVGHSMGGLVIRSACLVAETEQLGWLNHVRRALYLGCPHLGAPLEKVGNAISAVLGRIPNPFTHLARDLINRRSTGIKDLRYANLRDGDWSGLDPDTLLTNTRAPVALRDSIEHYVVAGTLTRDENHLIGKLLGDALVRLPSATAHTEHAGQVEGFAEGHSRIYPGLHHMRLARDRDVYRQLLDWCKA